MSNGQGSNRSQSYTKITDDQRNILSEYFDKGMTGTGPKHDSLIMEASSATHLLKHKVEKWIGNESQKRKRATFATLAEGPSQKKAAIPSFKRGPTQYNAFCAGFFKEECCKGLPLEEKNKMAASKWKLLSSAEKDSFKANAVATKHPDVTVLTEEEREHITKSYIKQIADQISFLSSLGCTAAMLILSPSGNLLSAGTENGQDFLATNPDIVLKFRQHFDVCDKSYTYRDVMTLFNLKYSEAIGKPSRVPYLKGGFEVVGLPEGVPFRKPYSYGKRQVNAIMTTRDNIKFILDANTNSDTCLSNVDNREQLENVVGQKQVLAKIVGEPVAKSTLQSKRKIAEDKVEVMDLSLNQTERLILYCCCQQLFDVDAWCAVGKNMKHVTESTQIILPVYTCTDEPYWLFYFPGKLDLVQKANPSTKLTGYWFDLKENRKYELMSEKSYILGKNVVKTGHGSLYYISDTKYNPGMILEMSQLFNDTIISVLNTSILS